MKRFDFTPSDKSVAKGGVGMTTGATIHTVGGLPVDVTLRNDHQWQTARPKLDTRPFMEKKTSMSVAQRLEPAAMTVPTPAELRRLFTDQAEALELVSTPPTATALEEAYKQCREVTQENSKTFFLGSQLLTEKEQRAVWAIYNWCRSTDELVDGPMAATTTMADLEEWEERLNRTFALKDSLQDTTNWEERLNRTFALKDSL